MADSVQTKRAKAFNLLFQDYDGPAFAVRLWDGWSWSSSPNHRPACTIVAEGPTALASLIARPSQIALGEAYIHGELDVEGDLFSVFSVGEYLVNRPRNLVQRIVDKSAAAFFDLRQWLQRGTSHSRQRDRSTIANTYDQPVEFYESWLGRSMGYTCAYFRNPDDSIDVAQEQKFDLICRKLRLQPYERFLEIGCGWGGLLVHAAEKFGADAQGVTLSQGQAEATRGRIARAGVEANCAVNLHDYRDLAVTDRPFDKVVSVGMFEHVGRKNHAQYFKIVHDLLRPGGVFLNHAIAWSASSSARQSEFVDRFVFPDAHLVTLSQALSAAESAGLEVRDVENLREHYDLTLRLWTEGLKRNANRLMDHMSKATYRTLLLCMAGSSAAFRRGDCCLYQVLFNRPDHGDSQLPLTREDLYAALPGKRPVASWAPSEPATQQTGSR